MTTLELKTKTRHPSWHPGLRGGPALIPGGKYIEDPPKFKSGSHISLGKGRGVTVIYISRKMRFKRSDFERVTKNTAVGTLL